MTMMMILKSCSLSEICQFESCLPYKWLQNKVAE